MKGIKGQSEFFSKIAVGCFFIVLMVIGPAIYRDYGVHWDEYNNQYFGRRMTNYVVDVMRVRHPLPWRSTDPHDKLHGPVFEVFLVACQHFFGLKDSRDIIFMRHLMTFILFYIGVVFFYLLCLRSFESHAQALLGCVFFVLSPRIFADAFYNTVDIPFLVFFVIGIYTLLVALDNKSFWSVAVHALVCALLIDVRLIGLFLTGLTVVFFGLESLYARSYHDKITILKISLYHVLLLIPLIVLFNPFLWSAPLTNFCLLIKAAINFKCYMHFLYLGESMPAYQFPWHYSWVWVSITTPLLYLALFLIGCFASVKSFFKNGPGTYPMKRDTSLFLLCFFIPMIMGKGNLYNGCRQIYFIYPFLLIVSLKGLKWLWQGIDRYLLGRARLITQSMLILLILISLLNTFLFMSRNHPFQNIYFNRIAGKTGIEIARRFELDYWGLSCRKALEYVLGQDKEAIVPIHINDKLPVDGNILPVRSRKRIRYTSTDKARYFFTLDGLKPSKRPCKEFYSIKVDGMKIIMVYKLDQEKPLHVERSDHAGGIPVFRAGRFI